MLSCRERKRKGPAWALMVSNRKIKDMLFLGLTRIAGSELMASDDLQSAEITLMRFLLLPSSSTPQGPRGTLSLLE